MQARTVTIVSAAMITTLSRPSGSPRGTPNRAVSLAFGDGVVRVKTDYPLGESITRMQQDIAAKGIMMFSTIDQAKARCGRRHSAAPNEAAGVR